MQMQVNEEILNSLKNLLITPQRDLGKEIKEKLFVLELGAEQVDYSRYQTDAVGCHGLPYQEWESQREKYKTEPFKIMVTKIADIDAYKKHIDKWSEEIYRDIIRLDFREIITIFEEIKDFRRILEGANGHIEKAYDKFWNDLVVASQGRKFKTLNTITQSMNGIESNYEDRSFSLSNFKDWVLPIFGYPAFEPISFKGHQNKRGVNDIGEHQEGHKYFEKPRVSTVSTHFDYLDTDFKIDGETVFITTLFLENVSDIIRFRLYAITSMLEKLEKFSQLHGGFIKLLPPATKKAEVKSIKKMNENDRLIKECFDKHLKEYKGSETDALKNMVTNKSNDVSIIDKEKKKIRQQLVRMGIWKGKKAT